MQELPIRDRTRRTQSVIAAQTTMIGAAVPIVTEVQSCSTLFVSHLPTETTREGIAFIDFDNDTGAAAAKGTAYNY